MSDEIILIMQRELTATNRDGGILKVGDRVTTNFHPKCEGVIFVVEQISAWAHCESKFLIVVHMEADPERKLLGAESVNPNRPQGIDTNWFKKIDE